MGNRNGKRGSHHQQGPVALHVKLQSRISTLQVENLRLAEKLANQELATKAALDGLQQQYEGKLARLHEEHTRELGVQSAQHAIQEEATGHELLRQIHLEVRRAVESRDKAAAKYMDALGGLQEQLEDTQRLRGEAMDQLAQAKMAHEAELASLRNAHVDQLAELRKANEELRQLVVQGVQLIDNMRLEGVAPGWLVQMYVELAQAKQKGASDAHQRERSGQLVAKVLRWCYEQIAGQQQAPTLPAKPEGEEAPTEQPTEQEQSTLVANEDQPPVQADEEGQPCGS